MVVKVPMSSASAMSVPPEVVPAVNKYPLASATASHEIAKSSFPHSVLTVSVKLVAQAGAADGGIVKLTSSINQLSPASLT